MPRKQWPLEIHGMDTILEDGVDVRDLDVKELLVLIFLELKKANIQLQSMTDEEINNGD